MVKLIGPAWTIVIVAVPKRLVSGLDVATTVTVAVVGTVAGAVYKPLASMVPQAGEHDVAVGEIRIGGGGLHQQPGYVVGSGIGC